MTSCGARRSARRRSAAALLAVLATAASAHVPGVAHADDPAAPGPASASVPGPAPDAGGDAGPTSRPGAGDEDGATGAPAPAAGAPRPQWGLGPFEVRDPFVLSLNRLSPWARSPEVLRHLQVEVALRAVWANSYGFARDRFVIDGEVRQAIPSVRVGLLDRLELAAHLPYEWRGGGALDAFIEGFHAAFGLPEQERDERPRRRYHVDGFEVDGRAFRYEHDGYGLSDLVLEARGLAHPGDAWTPALTLGLKVRCPTGRRKFDLSDGVDASLGVDASKRLGELPLVLYAGGSYTYHAHRRVGGLETLRHRGSFYLGFEWELLPWLSFTAHAWVESYRENRLFRDHAVTGPRSLPPADLTFGNHVTYVAFGLKAEPVDGLRIEVGALEDIVDPETTADFGWLANVSFRFGG